MYGPASSHNGNRHSRRGVTLIDESAKRGFTLIELSIVLVIIGLIVGGVLSGKELIRAAVIRASIGQIERFDTAANVFRGKYNGFPGDIANPTNYGFDDSGSTDGKPGNGLIDTTTNDAATFDTEAAVFFKHLYQAGMISEYVAGAADYTAAVDSIADFAPALKIGNSVRAVVYTSGGGYNYYFLGNISVTSGAITSYNPGHELAAIDAFQVDRKMDDGFPTTGRVTAMTDFDTLDAGAPAADGECVNTTPNPDAYNTGTPIRADDTQCSLRIRTSF